MVRPHPLQMSSPTLWEQRPMQGLESGRLGRMTLMGNPLFDIVPAHRQGRQYSQYKIGRGAFSVATMGYTNRGNGRVQKPAETSIYQ